MRKTLARVVAEEQDRAIEGVKMYVLPGGIAPKVHTGGSVGYDLHARAIVDINEKDPADPRFRKTVFDFEHHPADEKLRYNAVKARYGDKPLAWRIYPDESFMVGVGVVFSMPPSLFQWVAPRSGLASRRITLANAPGTIDSDYRGEAGVLIVNESERPCLIHHGDRIAQLLFQRTVFPQIDQVDSLDDLDATQRGVGGFGSTGYRAIS